MFMDRALVNKMTSLTCSEEGECCILVLNGSVHVAREARVFDIGQLVVKRSY